MLALLAVAFCFSANLLPTAQAASPLSTSTTQMHSLKAPNRLLQWPWLWGQQLSHSQLAAADEKQRHQQQQQRLPQGEHSTRFFGGEASLHPSPLHPNSKAQAPSLQAPESKLQHTTAAAAGGKNTLARRLFQYGDAYPTPKNTVQQAPNNGTENNEGCFVNCRRRRRV